MSVLCSGPEFYYQLLGQIGLYCVTTMARHNLVSNWGPGCGHTWGRHKYFQCSLKIALCFNSNCWGDNDLENDKFPRHLRKCDLCLLVLWGRGGCWLRNGSHSKDMFSDCILNIYTAHITRLGVKIYILYWFKRILKILNKFQSVICMMNVKSKERLFVTITWHNHWHGCYYHCHCKCWIFLSSRCRI